MSSMIAFLIDGMFIVFGRCLLQLSIRTGVGFNWASFPMYDLMFILSGVIFF